MTGIRGRWRTARERWPQWARVLSSGWIVWPFGVVSLLIVSLVVYGALTTAAPPKPIRGGAFGAPTTSPSSPSTTVLPSGSLSLTASPAPGATATPTAIATKTGPGTSPRRSGSRLALPTPGAYAVRVDGREGVRLTAFGFCNRTFPATSTLHVKGDYQGRATATSYQFDIQYSSLHSERHHYRYTPQGVFLEYEFAQVSCAGTAQATNVDYSPPQEKVRLPLRVGASWNGQGGDAQRTETYSAKVLRTQTLAIAGRALNTYVIETSIRMTGDEHGTRLQRWWYAPALAMPVQWHEEYDAARGPASYEAELTVTLVDLDPR